MGKGVLDRGVRGLEVQNQPLKMREAAWVEPLGSVVLFDDFTDDTVETSTWAITSPAATGGTDWAIDDTAGDPVAGHAGWISGTTGTADNDNEVINGKVVWKASRAGSGMLVFEARFSLPSVAALAFQMGLTDAVNELPFSLGASDAITSTATDAAVIILDVDADSDYFFGLNVDTDADGALVTLDAAPAATTAYRGRIEIDSSGNCFYYFSVGDSEVPQFKGMDAVGVTPTVGLGPFANVKCTGAAAAKVAEVDYILTACKR